MRPWIALVLLLLPAVPAAGSTAAADALRIARDAQPGWRLGAVRAKRHDGRWEVRAEILAGDEVVARLRVDPATGRLLGKRERAVSAGPSDGARLRQEVDRQFRDLVVGPSAWPSRHRDVWRVSVFSDGRLVAVVKVDVDARRVLARDEEDHDERRSR
jgi:hypothetical protein